MTDAGPRQSRSGAVLINAVSAVLAVLGIFLFLFGGVWAPAVLGLLADSALGAWIELIVPFLPIPPLVSAAYLITRDR